MNLLKRVRIILGLCGLIALGTVPWPVNRPFRWFCQVLESKGGWVLSASQARWAPWRHLSLTDLKLQTPQGGKLQFTQVWIRSNPLSLLRGHLATRWRLKEIRIDPGSWGIRKPLVQELLSAGPVATSATAVLEMGLDSLQLEELALQGPFLQLQAQGWLTAKHQAHVTMKGALARRLLEEMNLMKPADHEVKFWEPFRVGLHGMASNPEFFFASNFFSISMNSNGDQKP